MSPSQKRATHFWRKARLRIRRPALLDNTARSDSPATYLTGDATLFSTGYPQCTAAYWFSHDLSSRLISVSGCSR